MLPPGVAVLFAAILFPVSCTEPFMQEVSVNVVGGVIAPMVVDGLHSLWGGLFNSQDPQAIARAKERVGLKFAEDLVRNHHYWCDSRESDRACIDRITPLVTEDFRVVLKKWDQSFYECKQAAEDATDATSDEIKMINDIFACMKKRGYGAQIEALRGSEENGS